MFKNRTILYTLLGLFTLLLAACTDPETPTDSYDLTVFISDTDASGTVTSDDGLISCPGDCAETYTAGKVVVLTAEAAEGFEFEQWVGGTCEGEVTDATCSLTVDNNTDITATFKAAGDPGPVTPDPVTVEIPLIGCEVEEEDEEEEEDPNRLKCNDAEEFTGGDTDGTVLVSSSDLELNYNGEDTPNTSQLVGVRFVPTLADIPTGAVISEAYVQFTAKASNDENAEAPTITVKAETLENGDPAEFIGTPSNLSSRSVTDSGVEWTPAPWVAGDASEATRTPNLASLFETIAWQPGSAVVFLFENDGTTASRNAFSGDPTKDEDGNELEDLNPDGPRLVVTYTPPSGS